MQKHFNFTVLWIMVEYGSIYGSSSFELQVSYFMKYWFFDQAELEYDHYRQ